jgi:hypothetical protein
MLLLGLIGVLLIGLGSWSICAAAGQADAELERFQRHTDWH